LHNCKGAMKHFLLLATKKKTSFLECSNAMFVQNVIEYVIIVS